MSGIRAHLEIHGKVQGVYYRDTTRKEAESRQVKGWVRNLANGNVEAVFEGGRDAVEQLIEWCHQGPRAARVTKVEVTFEPFAGEFSDFRVLY